ncbi:MAG: chloride channel protein, partial [Saccharofermentanales bacterium]
VEKYIPSQYLRVIVGGCAIIALTLLFGTDYDGLGTDVIARAINEGECHPLAFILKIVFTLLTLCFGYKGGEIIPAFFVGATFGCLFGNLCGFSPMLCAAIGMVCVFCGVTNCPLSSLFIAVELFGFTDVEYFIIAVGIAYVISGYFSLYSSQDIIYSKTEATFINKKAK